MYYEQVAKTKQGMEKRIKELETMLKDMQSDFAKCAQGVSPCFFCENDDACQCSDGCNSEFVWAKHI